METLALLLLVLVLAALAAAAWFTARLWRRDRARPQGHSGGEEPPLGKEAAEEESPPDALANFALDRILALEEEPRKGGGEKKEGRGAGESWRKYKNWDDLESDLKAYKAYSRERDQLLKHLPSNWSKVWDALRDKLEDDREWGGNIDVGGEGCPEVEALYSSSLKVGENTEANVAAMITAEDSQKFTERPSLLVFHTHPRGTSTLVSPSDLAFCILESYRGRTAGHALVTPDAIVLYGLLPQTRSRILDSHNIKEAAYRYAFDVYTSFEALRSYGDGYTVRDVEGLAARLGLFYITFPTDAYAQRYHNTVYVPHEKVNIRRYIGLLRKLEQVQKE